MSYRFGGKRGGSVYSTEVHSGVPPNKALERTRVNVAFFRQRSLIVSRGKLMLSLWRAAQLERSACLFNSVT